jgi:hypothetical protein
LERNLTWSRPDIEADIDAAADIDEDIVTDESIASQRPAIPS